DLPVVQVRDIQVHPRDNDLLLATHGRGLYIMDDISALQGLESAQSSDAVLFDIRPATRWSMWNRDGNLGQKKWTGENPPQGALITYYLKNQPPGEVNITITDRNNRVVRRMRRVADDAGINRVVWDLRHDAPAGVGGGRGGRGGGGGAGGASTEGPQGGAAPDTSLAAFRARRAAAALAEADAQPGGDEGGFGRGGGAGLDVLPGVYTVSLSVNGKQLTKTVQVDLDPRSDMTPTQLTAQFETATQLNDLATRVNAVISGVDDLLGQLTSLQGQVRRNAATAQPQQQLLTDIGSTIGELRHFRDSVLARPLAGLGYRQYPRLREEVQTVSGMVARPLMPPTAGELLRMGELRTEADQAQARLDAIVQNRISKINQALSGTPHVIVPQRAGPIIP
ncbi:MAG TPA: hypothetical protein VI259_03290, partial [Gemmatimonadaceae bacterium]